MIYNKRKYIKYEQFVLKNNTNRMNTDNDERQINTNIIHINTNCSGCESHIPSSLSRRCNGILKTVKYVFIEI